MKNFFLNKKLAFVVGGSGQIGKEIVKIFSEAGATVISLDIKKKFSKNLLLKSKKNISYNYFNCSLNNLEKKYYDLVKKYGSPEVFVNCSYPMTKDWKNTSFSNIKKKFLDENIKIHLNSYSWLAKLAAEDMKNNKIEGSIIQFGSIYGILGQDLSIYKNTKMHESMAYSIIKGGITNLTRQMASYYGKYNIRINTISPGGIVGSVQGIRKSQEKNFIKNYSLKVPLSRLGSAEEISYSVLFLASDASSYITGSNLAVDGGWSII